MLLVIDNYDSFTYNLVQYFGELGEDPHVARNDAIGLDEIAALAPTAIVLSPGPGTPADAGITIPVIKRFGATVPILGVCLGHQAIGEAYGGRVIRAPRGVMHGKTSLVRHDGSRLFDGLTNPLEVMRYHSLVVESSSVPAELEVTAVAVDDASEIHAMQHRSHPVYGVQFHPESIGTKEGKRILGNFLRLSRLVALALFIAIVPGCVPYSVGHTAQPVPIGETVRRTSVTYVIGGYAEMDDTTGTFSRGTSQVMFEAESRTGRTESSDVGFRLTPGGAIVSWKNRHAGIGHPDSAAVATMFGVGVINAFHHAHFEGTLLLSSRKRGTGLMYGGLRVMQTLPIARAALRDDPAGGLFFGARFGSHDFGLTPEIAVFYDHSVTGLRQRNWILVPSITFQGLKLPRLPGTVPRPPRPTFPR